MRPRVWFVLFGLLLITASAKTLYAASDELVPAGTILTVRTTEPLYADYTHPGMRLIGIVDDPVVDVGGRIVVPRGAQATLEVVGVERSSTMKGRDRITLKMQSLHFGGASYPVSASYVQLKGPSEGKKAAKKIAGGAGIGAALGGLIGGGSGAAWGALAGGGTGAAVTGSGKKHLSIPAETRIQFQLTGTMRIER
jgi:hypothetical protein